MPWRRRRLELHREIPFLGHTNQRCGRFQPRQDAFGNQQSFINDEFKFDLARFEQRGNTTSAAFTAGFFIGAKRQINRAFGFETVRGQQLDGFQLRNKIAFIIPRATPPDEAVLLLTSEWIGLPIILRSGRNGHDVLMRHQHNWCQRRISASPLVQQTQPNLFARQRSMSAGITRLEKAVKFEKLLGILQRVIVARNCLESDGGAQSIGRSLFVNRHRRDRHRGNLPTAVTQRIETHCRNQHHDRHQQNPYNALEHVSVPLHC